MSAAEPLIVLGAEVPAQVSASGQAYYTLSHLAEAKETKAVAFVSDGAFTLKVERYEQRETVRGRKYFTWVRQLALTTTVKRNARGLVSVNVFRTLKGAKLTNESLNPRAFWWLETSQPLLGEAYLVLLARTYRAVTGGEPATAKGVLNRPFVEEAALSADGFVYADFARYAYPAYAEFAARATLAATKDEPGFPHAFAPYLREPSWARMVEKLFGTTLPQAVREQLEPECLTMAQLAGAFMVRSLVPSTELLAHPYAFKAYSRGGRGGSIGTGWWLLGEARRVLRAVEPNVRRELLRNFSTKSADFQAFEKVLLGHAYAVRQSGKQLAPLPKLAKAGGWAELGVEVSALYARVNDAEASKQVPLSAAFQRAAQACFESVPDFAKLDDQSFVAVTAHGSLRDVWRMQGDGVNFDMRLFGPRNFLPHNSPLDRPRKLARSKMLPHRKDAHLSLGDATAVIIELHRVLDNLLVRHNVPKNARNRTRAYVALSMFFTSAYAAKAKITANWWDVIASELELVQVYEAFILNASAAEFGELLQVPVVTRLALSGYEPFDPKTTGISLGNF